MVLIHAKMGLLGHRQEWDNSREGWSCSVWAVSALGVLMVNTCSHKLHHLCNTSRDAGRIQLENDNFMLSFKKKKKPFLFKEACSIMEEGRSQKRDAVKIRQKEDMLKWLGIRPIILG